MAHLKKNIGRVSCGLYLTVTDFAAETKTNDKRENATHNKTRTTAAIVFFFKENASRTERRAIKQDGDLLERVCAPRRRDNDK